MDVIKSIEHEQMKNKIPVLNVGNTVKVHVRVKEGNRERIQVFEGIIIKVQGGGVNQTFTVRKTSYGVGVEKTFLVHSPTVEKVEVVRVGKARRAKLFYLRDRLGKSAKTREKIGARIETKEVTIKEELAEEPAKEETPATETTEPAEEKVEKASATETAEEKAEEMPAVETKTNETVTKKETAKASPEVKKEKTEAPKVEESKAETPKTEEVPDKKETETKAK